MKYNYPTCRKADLTEDYFGTELPAPYTWLRNTNDPEVLDFTARENKFTDDWFDTDEVNDMVRKLKEAEVPEPVTAISPWREGYLATQILEGNYKVVELDKNLQIVRTLFKRYDIPERTMFSAAACPADQNLLAMMSQVDAAPRPDMLIYDFDAQKVLAVLPMTFSGEWSKAGTSFYAPSTAVEEERSVTTVRRWDKETNTLTDILEGPGNTIFGDVSRSEDGTYFVFGFSVNYSDKFFYSYHEPTGRITALNETDPLELIYVDSVKDVHYFISLKESDHGILLAVPEGKTITDAEVVYREEEGYMDGGACVGGELFIHIQKCAASEVKHMPEGTVVPLPEKTGALSPAGKAEGKLFFGFDSFTALPRILSFDGEKFETVLYSKKPEKDEAEKPGQEPEIAVELLFAESTEDRVKIPYYLVRRKDADKNKSHPALMYGYGGYNISMPPWSKERVSGIDIPEWVRNGGIYVHCLLRGGNEYGPAWHVAGMGLHKKNCYYDFIGIAEKVISDGWTDPAHIVISGCSNGGLLMSTLVTMRPDLWGCVIDSVPHTDMIHFADDDRGSMYITEYGDPRESREMFEYLLSYSPVHNVKKTAYPPVYIQTGECDNNVPPYHGKSFAAMMQANNTGDSPVLLRVLKEGSHDRGQGEVYWRTIAEMRVFIRKALLK